MNFLPDVARHLRLAHYHGPVAQPGRVGDLRAVVEPQATWVLQPPGTGVINHLQQQSVEV